MMDFHRDRLAMARTSGESIVGLWLRTVIDVVTSAAAEQARSILPRDPVMRTLSQDLAYAVRGLMRQPRRTRFWACG
jgi:hypothetical protein